jgi:hypothetical protein
MFGSLQIKIAACVVAAVAITGVGYLIYDAIYDRGYQAAVLVKDAEAKAKEDANNKVIANAEKGLREDLALIILEKEKLEDEVARLNREAAQDPGAVDGALGLGSVQRLNSVR